MSSLSPDLDQYDPACIRCPRLANFLDEVHREHGDYHCRPVAPFGDPAARLLVVGLAPGKHGANATGRPFTGDFAGILLYRTLYEHGFGSAPVSTTRDDGLVLQGCRITNAVKCLPPDNKPLTGEVRNCNAYLRSEIASLPRPGLVLALGTIAHGAVLRATGQVMSRYRFSHGDVHDLVDGLRLLDSYHCSRYNTQTGRLSAEGFSEVFATARRLLAGEVSAGPVPRPL